MFGRSDDEWDSLLDNAIAVLKDQAGRRRMTTYSELNAELVRQTGQPAFDFSIERDRTAMGKLLGQVVTQTRDESGAMLSAIVAYIDRNDAGPGFYKLAMLAVRPLSGNSPDPPERIDWGGFRHTGDQLQRITGRCRSRGRT